ncbi:MotE family protein [Chengkuizengella sp. SCS-71B]|uniref:MotE family protein n=1 Tax=Chengkuizengella sp. SCS-71B TaxID=3115290 RepID=UPI0032C2290E
MDNIKIEGSSMGVFSKVFYWFLIPVIFTTILIFVLDSINNFNVLNMVLKVGNKIPYVETLVPDVEELDNEVTVMSDEEKNVLLLESIELELDRIQTELVNEVEISAEKDQVINELQTKIDLLEDQLIDKITMDEYAEKIKETSKIYADMLPSKAASIFENLTMSETVLMLNAMNKDDQVKILEKMNPEMAAEASILLKDTVSVMDQQIAALQARLKEMENREPKEDPLSNKELSLTISTMVPENAASILLEMKKQNQELALNILRETDTVIRSNIIQVISEISETDAAEFLTLLAKEKP